MPVLSLVDITAVGVQVAAIGSACFAVAVVTWGIHAAKRAL